MVRRKTQVRAANPADRRGSRLRRIMHVSAMACISLAALSGCGGGDLSDLQKTVAGIKAKPAGRIAPLPEFKTYETYAYGVTDLRDPFQIELDRMVEPEVSPSTTPGPDPTRTPEALEQFPLDTLEFVGDLRRGNRRWAIITAPDGLVYRVQVGNYMGQNYGKIIAIGETDIQLVELVRDGLGGWIERDATLSLSE